MAQTKRPRARSLLIIVLVLAIGSLGAGAVALVRGFLNSAPPQPKKLAQEFHVIRPPPPPPDQPPPPPPPPEEKVIPDPQRPDPTPSDEPPPGERLGLDAEGSAGGDAFGLLANKGGRDLLGSGGNAFTWYAGLLKNEIVDQLDAERQARVGEYAVVVRVWVRDDGSIDRVRIIQSSGNRERDRAIESALGRIARLSRAPPADMPEPITVRIVSHG